MTTKENKMGLVAGQADAIKDEIKNRFNRYIEKGMSSSDTLAQVAKEFKVDWETVEKAM